VTVYQHKKTGAWYYDFRLAGERHAGRAVDPDTGQAARNKRDAERIENIHRGKASLSTPAKGTVAPKDYTLAQAIAAYADRKQRGKNWANQRTYAKELLGFFGADTPVGRIEEKVWPYITWSRQQPVKVYAGQAQDGTPRYKQTARTRSDSTINRYLDCLRSILGVAHEARDWAGKRVLDELPDLPDLREPIHLPRPIPDADLVRIMEAAPPHLTAGVFLTRLMGFRKAEVFSLRVDQIDLERGGVWLSAAETKGARDEFVAAPEAAMPLLEQLVADASDAGVPWLISYQARRRTVDGDAIVERRPVRNPKRAWATVLRRLGLSYRFHDLKASFVSAVAMSASGATTQKLARHRDFSTTQRYLAVADHEARAAVEKSASRLAAAATGRIPSSKLASQTDNPEPVPLPSNPLGRMVGATGFEPATPSPPD